MAVIVESETAHTNAKSPQFSIVGCDENELAIRGQANTKRTGHLHQVHHA
jgi:hypothetical protein